MGRQLGHHEIGFPLIVCQPDVVGSQTQRGLTLERSAVLASLASSVTMCGPVKATYMCTESGCGILRKGQPPLHFLSASGSAFVGIDLRSCLQR